MSGQGSSEANMNVLSNLYSHVRQAIKWQNEPAQRGVQGGAMGRISPDSHVIPCDRSSINSPVSIDPFDSGPSMPYGNHQSNGASQPTFDHLIESACDIMVRHDATDDQMAPSENRVAYDDFEPIPLSKIEGIHPSSMSVLDQNITSSSAEDDLFLFEPRSIEDMVERPSNAPTMFNNIPSLSPRQQAWAEYSLPLFLPLIFYVGKLSKFGILWCSVIIVGHTLQTLFTAFEPAAADLRYKPSIGMIQHHFIDCIWVQSLVSAMLLTPQNFGANSVYTGVFLIPLVPIYLAVSLKTHFEQKVLENATYATTARSIKRRQKLVQQVGETLRDTVVWYLASIAVVLLGHHTFSFNLIVLGVFVLNAAPISTLASYTGAKSSAIRVMKGKLAPAVNQDLNCCSYTRKGALRSYKGIVYNTFSNRSSFVPSPPVEVKQSAVESNSQESRSLSSLAVAVVYHPPIIHHLIVTMVASSDGSFSTTHHLDSPEFSFPFRLFLLLKHAEEQGMEDIISWTEDGKGFKVHDPNKFESMFLAENFKMKKYASFTRQLCAYGFSCIRKGRKPDFHPDFCRDNADASSKISRGGGKKYATLCKKSKLSNTTPQTIPIPPPLLVQQGISGTPSIPANPLMFMNQGAERSNSEDASKFAQSANLPSMLGQGTNEGNINVWGSLYSHVRQAIAWQNQPAPSGLQAEPMGRTSPDSDATPSDRSSIASPVSIDPFDSGASTSNGNHQSHGASQAPFDHLVESACDIVVRHDATDDQMVPSGNRVAYDDFEPIPLSKIEGIHPSSMPRQDQDRNVSSAEDDLFLFEPRPIEDMVEISSNAPTLFNSLPSLSPRQQAWSEYSMPVFLPLVFYLGDLSQFGLLWCTVIVVGHTLQTMVTYFGSAATDLTYKPAIGLLQHHFIDCIWMQSLYSAMLLVPNQFGPYSVYVGAAMIPMMPTYVAVSLKTHFERTVLMKANARYQTTRYIKRKQRSIEILGETISSAFAGYFIAVTLALIGHFVGWYSLVLLGVFVMNTMPLATYESYKDHVKKSSRMLIHKRKLL
eukprot:scaffold6683_cov103-Cylindrotheca_fusiformis.AAC.4